MKVAKTYQSWNYDETKAYKKNGKMYVKASCKCDRCVKGVFICRIENGMPVPHPNAGGVCFQCGGTGILSKEVRLYTDKEFDQMQKSAETAAKKREVAREEKMKVEYDQKRAAWLEKNGFNENETTYVYFPSDSYEVKETLKENGFRFSNFLLWHIANIPEGYEDKVIEIKREEVAEMAAWGEGHYIPNTRSYVEQRLTEARPAEPKSEWIGIEKERIFALPVVMIQKREMTTRFGYTQLCEFRTAEGSILQWWTASNVEVEVGDNVFLTGTIKSHDEYKGRKITTVKRCTFKVN